MKMKYLKCIFLFLYSFIVVNDNYFIIASDLYRRNYQTNSNKKSYKSVSPIVLQDEESNFSHNAEKPATYKRVSPKVLENYKQKHGDFFDSINVNVNNGLGDIYEKLQTIDAAKKKEIEEIKTDSEFKDKEKKTCSCC